MVSIHAPLNDETRRLVGAEALAAAKRGTGAGQYGARARSSISMRLEIAMRDGNVAGAGLDVLPSEPGDLDHPLARGVAQWREPWIARPAGRHAACGVSTARPRWSIFGLNRSKSSSAYLVEGRLTNCVNAEYLK